MPHDHAIQCLHDPLLVVLSYLVSVLGAFTALQVAIGIPAARTDAQRRAAIVGGGVAMGGGAIWAMHFIAMLACRMDVPVTYDPGLTLLSALMAIGACMLGLAIAGTGLFSWGKLAVAGTCMGLGVAAMHYTGMAAMRMPATAQYDMGVVLLSVAIAIVASAAALWLAFNLRGWVQMLGSALVMGVAVCGMHYTGMYAVSFVATGEAAVAGGLGGAYLGMGVFMVATLLLSAMLVIILLRRQRRAAVTI
ncbi:MHYT domain-containing protein [Luteimonas sp. R10]|uniref:MHYT domain-containing protein n=1 Tax=Luteimonas sp. R10 TaxID=3108176 RepID=UPI0030928ECC|nr:MHYT domain-containing protein [Luteimonas sp. R10]